MDDTSRRLSDAENTGATGEDLDEVSAHRAREIRSEIEHTREDMSEAIDAIQEKLRPGNIAAAASDRVKDVAGTAVRNAAEAASSKAQHAMERTRRMADDLAEGGRMNTIASAMIGIGSAWLLVDRLRNSGQRRYGSLSDYEYGDERSRSRRARHPGVEEYGAGVASDEGVISQSYDRASSMAHEARDRARETARRARSGFANLLESNPLMVVPLPWRSEPQLVLHYQKRNARTSGWERPRTTSSSVHRMSHAAPSPRCGRPPVTSRGKSPARSSAGKKPSRATCLKGRVARTRPLAFQS